VVAKIIVPPFSRVGETPSHPPQLRVAFPAGQRFPSKTGTVAPGAVVFRRAGEPAEGRAERVSMP
jgi:hypothetical protein